MKIYTKTGDVGETSLFGGRRVLKSELRIEAYGTVDELNSWIGLLRDVNTEAETKELLKEIQDRLFTIGSILAVEPGNTKVKVPALSAEDITFLEKKIDSRFFLSEKYFCFLNMDLPIPIIRFTPLLTMSDAT